MSKPKDKPTKARNATLAIDSIKCYPSLQMRHAGLLDAHVADIAEAIKAHRPIERVRVFYVDGEFVLTEGFHRVAAHKLAGVDKVLAVVIDGTWLDAAVDASQGNKNHLGLKRTQADRRRACQRLIEEVESSGRAGWTAARYAKTVDVSRDLAREILNAYLDRKLAEKAKDAEPVGEFKAKDAAGLPTLFTEPHVPEFRIGVNDKKYAVKPRTPEPAFEADDWGYDEPPAVDPKARTAADDRWEKMEGLSPAATVQKNMVEAHAAQTKEDAKPFDFKRHDDHVRRVAQAADRLADRHPTFKGSPEYRNLISQFAAYAETWAAVRKRWEWHTKAKPTEDKR
jgi:hypothetical protein